VESQRYIWAQCQIVMKLASQAAISGDGCREQSQKPMEDHCKPAAHPSRPAQKASANAVSQQAAPAKVMPCRLGVDLCQELHQLEKSEQFRKLSPEQRVVNVDELHICLICMRHTSDKECYQTAKAMYKGGREAVCGIDHRRLQHWALIVAACFKYR
jgi:hypothetical protein